MAIQADGIQFGPWQTVNYSVPAIDLEPNVLSRIENMYLDNAGSLNTRRGTAKYISSALSGSPSVVATGKQRFSASSSAVFVIAGTKLYEDVDGTWTDRTASITITAHIDKYWVTTNAGGTLIGVNGIGNDAPIKWPAAGGNIAAAGMGSSGVTSADSTIFWDNRLWYVSTNQGERLAHYSSTTDITSFGANDYYITDGQITGVAPIKSFLGLHNEDGIWGLFPTGNADIPYSIQRRADRGTISRRSLVTDEFGNQLFMRRDGIYEWGGSEPPQKVSGNFDGSEFWDYINKDRLSYSFAHLVTSDDQVWFWLPYGTNQQYMNVAIVWNYKLRQWVGVYTANTRICGAYFNDLPHLGGNADGLLFKHNTGTNDASLAFTVKATTAATPPVSVATRVRWLYARHEFNAADVAYDTSVYQTGPGIVTKGDTFQVGDPTDALVTEFTIGSSSIRSATTAFVNDTDLHGYSPVSQIRYENSTLDQPITVRRSMLMYKPIGPETVRKLGVH